MGCSKGDSEKTTDVSSIAEEGITTEIPKGIEILEDSADFTAVTADQTYQFETDMNSGCMANNNITDAGEMIYTVIDNKYLCAFPKSGEKAEFLCNKPDCTHNDLSCNGLLTNDSVYGIQYYEGFLYYTVIGSGSIDLYKVNLDGSERERVCNLATVETHGDGANSINWIIHRGSIYYVYRMEAGETEDGYYLNGSNCIYRRDLEETQDSELLMAVNCGMDSQYVPLKGYGSYLYFVSPEELEGEGTVYRYNTESDKLEKMQELGNDVTDLVMYEGNIYYKKHSDDFKNVYEYDEKKNENKLFLTVEEGGLFELYCDHEYLYLLCEDTPDEGTVSLINMKVYAWDKETVGDVLFSGMYVLEENIAEDGTFLESEQIRYLGSDEGRIYY
jgi:hypothetical protein